MSSWTGSSCAETPRDWDPFPLLELAPSVYAPPMPEYESSTAHDSPSAVFSLTQIRHLMRVEFNRAQRYSYPLSCVIVACDRLDHLRDKHGFEIKETVLEDVIGLLQGATRNCDYLGRLMDDRLMAILPHTGREGGEATARRILRSARELKFQAGGETLDVSLSVGLSHYENENTMFFDSLVEAAESALAEAFEGGGDRFAYRDPGPGKG